MKRIREPGLIERLLKLKTKRPKSNINSSHVLLSEENPLCHDYGKTEGKSPIDGLTLL